MFSSITGDITYISNTPCTVCHSIIFTVNEYFGCKANFYLIFVFGLWKLTVNEYKISSVSKCFKMEFRNHSSNFQIRVPTPCTV